MTDFLELIGRRSALLMDDIHNNNEPLGEVVRNSSFLILGSAGSFGQVVTKELFKRNPQKLYVVDVSEHNRVEIVRGIRSSLGFIDGVYEP